jgi:hypothetical protein
MLESYLKEKIKEVKEIREFYVEGLNYVNIHISWILHMAEKYNIQLDDIQKLTYIYKKTGQILENNSPTESQQRNKTTEEETESKFIIVPVIIYY